ncbi:stage II sporulation protein P [Clostridium tyrobutyricum]|uniref:stage II sporulation protein P n=1 Tax=Clostridium tyrobutyricum TaxID=1519 RepID=UPI0030CCFF65
MKNIYKNIAIAAAFVTIGTGYTYSKYQNKIAANKVVVSDTVLNSTKKSPNTYTQNSIVPFSSDIVVYNSHPDETYQSGKSVTDIGSSLNNKLTKYGLKSSFIKINAPKEYKDSYENTRNIIKKNVKNYSNTILLDISRDESLGTLDKKNIKLIVSKNSPNYEANKKFVNQLLVQLKNTNGVTAEILYYNKRLLYFNQDLSKNAIHIEIGNDKSSDSDVQKGINAVAAALKNIQNK